ncbi:MAG: rRNA maturation RNase YbeY [Eubacterium sp.]|nr:rRNA maturation RNase YbeY [Eubacterium sp.]
MIYIDNKYKKPIEIDYQNIAYKVIEEAENFVECPYECEVNLLITDNEEVQQLNKTTRDIDSPTDVLSYPAFDFNKPADFSNVDENDYNFNPESGELVLGDIVISYDKVIDQADEYNHSQIREFAFLIAHSMLHLFGYDHLDDDERKAMELDQESILNNLNIRRD